MGDLPTRQQPNSSAAILKDIKLTLLSRWAGSLCGTATEGALVVAVKWYSETRCCCMQWVVALVETIKEIKVNPRISEYLTGDSGMSPEGESDGT